MKYLIIALFLLLSPHYSGAQLINVFAGGGSTLGDGGLVSCQFNFVC